ncbi:MAG: L-fucokinase [Phycisphaerae bacterium]
MPSNGAPWDYLVLTASNDRQAAAYQAQVRRRVALGMLSAARRTLVIADVGGKRIGSGGSTILCLMRVLAAELAGDAAALADPASWRRTIERLRILIVHAGGDSRRLPAYGPCGKAFVPVPGDRDGAVPATLFDRQVLVYLDLPSPAGGGGQVVITAGDVLLLFDPGAIRFADRGITGLGCPAPPELASHHGVFNAGADGRVRRFLQKPSPAEQEALGVLNRYGQSILDIGVMSFGAETAARLLALAGAAPDGAGGLAWTGEPGAAIEEAGLDFYREICCALGSKATADQYVEAALAAGSGWDEAGLRGLFEALRGLPFYVDTLPRCRFLHFGTTRQVITSGIELLMRDRGVSRLAAPLDINNELSGEGRLAGAGAWVEACRIAAPVTLAGDNVLTGADVKAPLDLARGACLDVLCGTGRAGESVRFIRCYGIGDTFKEAAGEGATFCNVPLAEWLRAVGAEPGDVWDAGLPTGDRSAWNARLFPAVEPGGAFAEWLWMFAPAAATARDRRAWLQADRYSAEEIAALASQDAFHERRLAIRAMAVRESLRQMFRHESGFSAADLAMVLEHTADRAGLLAEVLIEASWYAGDDNAGGDTAGFVCSRILHTVGSAVERLARGKEATIGEIVPGLREAVPPETRTHLADRGISLDGRAAAAGWAAAIKTAAFEHLRRVIVTSTPATGELPRSALRSDEIVWGRAPARLDLGGGWTDTPPYALEYGGSVINAAVDLNGQPPIHVYARVIPERVIRIGSIDLGVRVEVASLEDLLDYRSATSEFALAKAALAMSGLSPETAPWPAGTTLEEILDGFGGGLELTTLAAIPKGSGLGTSSIVGAVILAVIQRAMGRTLTPVQLFHGVLRLEQALTTGGGWQDQIGGAVGGVKVIQADPGLVPDARIHYVPEDVLDPRANGGATLLYYTGITRLAKNILQQVVGRYLDRDRAAMATLGRIHALPPRVAEAMARKDLAAFGAAINEAWELNKALDPNSSTDEIEALLERVRPHLAGAKLLGAGGGGFLLMVCRSAGDAAAVRSMLEKDPPNKRARFFAFGTSADGLVVTVC